MSKNTRNEEHICLYQPPYDVERNQKAWRLITHEQKAGTSGNPERRTMKGSSWKNFQPGRDGIGSLRKNDKRKGIQKAEFEKIRFRSLKGREIIGQPSRDTLERKVNKRLFGKKHQKKKIMRNKEGTSHQSCWHNIGFSTQGSKGGESVVPWNPRMTL